MTKIASTEITDWSYDNSHIAPANLCVYEFQLPENANPGDKLEVQIRGFNENMEFLFAFGTSLENAKSETYPEGVGGWESPGTDPDKWVAKQEDKAGMSGEGTPQIGDVVTFTVEHPNNVYLTMRNWDTDQTEFKPFTISYSRIEGLPFASVWKYSLPLAGAPAADTDTKAVTTPVPDEAGLPAFVVILVLLIGLLLAAAVVVFLVQLLKNLLKNKQ